MYCSSQLGLTTQSLLSFYRLVFLQLSSKIIDALVALTPAESKSYNFFTVGWTHPTSLGPAISMLEGLDIMRTVGERRECAINGLSVFTCPEGSFARPVPDPVCQNITCPPGAVFCICGLCKFSDEFVVSLTE